MKNIKYAWNRKAIFTAIIASLFFGCAKKEESASLGTGGLTAAQVAGNRWSSCTAISSNTYGTDVNGMSYIRGLSLVEDGTYAISTLFFTGTTCQLGGTHIFTYSQAGTFQTGGIVDTPSGATEIVYTVVGSLLTTYGGTAGATRDWAGYFNTNCPGGPTIDTNADATNNVTGITCSSVASPTFAFPAFTTAATILYDVISLTDATAGHTVVTVGDLDLIWNMGKAGSYPTSATQTFSE